jgi:bacillithiol system protein YtxJ
MAWIKLNSSEVFDELIAGSAQSPRFIFKHSIRCSISAMAWSRLQEATKKTDIYIIDVINNRDISNAVAHKLDVPHQSPQLLVVGSGVCTYHVSHMEISSNVICQFDAHRDSRQ